MSQKYSTDRSKLVDPSSVASTSRLETNQEREQMTLDSMLFPCCVYDNVPFLPSSTTTFLTYHFSCNLYQSIPALTRSKLDLGYIIIFCFVLINVNFIIPPAFFPLLFETYRRGSDITSSLGNLPYFLLK